MAAKTKVHEAIRESVPLSDGIVPQIEVLLRGGWVVSTCSAWPMTAGVIDVAVVTADVEEAVVGEGGLSGCRRRLAGEGALYRGVVAGRQQWCGSGGGMCRGTVSVDVCVCLGEAWVGLIGSKRTRVARVLFLEVTRCVVVAVDGASAGGC